MELICDVMIDLFLILRMNVCSDGKAVRGLNVGSTQQNVSVGHGLSRIFG